MKRALPPRPAVLGPDPRLPLTEGPTTARPLSVEELIEAAVERAIRRSLGPYLHRLSSEQPAVYTVAQAAEVLQVSSDTVGRMVRRGVLPKVPHVGGKVLIPRRCIERLLEGHELAEPSPSLVGCDGATEPRSYPGPARSSSPAEPPGAEPPGAEPPRAASAPVSPRSRRSMRSAAC